MNERDKALKESFDFISSNLNINFDEIPQDLVRSWSYDFKSGDERQYEFAWTIFTYVLLCAKKSKGVFEFSESEERLTKLFSDWQLCLSLVEINAVTDLKVHPFNIFDVENLGKVTVGFSQRKSHG